MACTCFDAKVDDSTEILCDITPTAQKIGQCHECARTIRVGEKYRLENTVYQGRISTHNTCADCDSVRKHLVCSFCWGELWELVRKSIFCDAENQQPWSRIGRLTPRARERVCAIIEATWED